MTAAKIPKIERKNLPLQTRLASLEEQQAETEDRVFNVIFTTGAIVRRYNIFADETYDEELVVNPTALRLGRLNSGAAPVLDTHSDFALDNIKGVVMGGSARIENGLGYASLKIDGGAENESVIRKIRDGIIRNVSVGYRVHRYEVIRSEGTVPLYRAVDWEPYEISLVPIGADAGAGIRSNPHTFPCEIINPQPSKELRLMTDIDNKPQEQDAPVTEANKERFLDGVDEDEALDLLRSDVGKAERAVLRLIAVPLTQGQFDALVSFTFNLGAGALQRSTLRRKVNREEHDDVPAELMKWVWAGGRKLKGLVKRRAAEAGIYIS